MRRTQLFCQMTLVEIWPVCRPCRGNMRDWRETSLPSRIRSDSLSLSNLKHIHVHHTHTLSLETQVAALGEEARRLQAAHADSSDQIAAKQAEIVGLWEGLKRKASQRSTRLGDALHFQKFLADCWYVLFALVYVSVRESVCVLGVLVGSWSHGCMIWRLSLLQWSLLKTWHLLKLLCRATARGRFKHQHTTTVLLHLSLYLCINLSVRVFRVRLMQKRTVSRPPLSLARVSSPLATLPRRKSRHTSRVWPARERLCWSRGSRNRRSSSSAWSCRCSSETLIRLTAGWPNKRSPKKLMLDFSNFFSVVCRHFWGTRMWETRWMEWRFW